MNNQTKNSYPHTQYEIISDINSLIDKIQANKKVFVDKEVNEQGIKDYKKIIDGIKNLEALREAIANIQW